MPSTKIAIHSVNSALVGLAEMPYGGGQTAAVYSIPGGGRVLIDAPEVLERVAQLLGPSGNATNPFEQRRRKEFLRRAGRTIERLPSSPTEVA